MRWPGYLAAGITVGVLLAVLRVATVETAGVAAPVLLVTVVIIARFRGTGPALLAAALSAGGLSYYFLPPAGFEIEQPEDWVAFITFVVAAVVAGELASRAERRTAEAQQGRLEIERLYQQLQAAFDRASEAEAARRSEQLKAALLDALTHNLRTPLTSIKAAVTALIGASDWTPQSELSSEGRRELLLVIDEESDRLNRFIEGLSSADRRDVSQSPTLRRERLDDIVKAAVARADNLTRDHRVSVSLAESLPSLSVDPASIIEVLYTLIDNASKYSPPATRIRVTASVADDHFVRVSVADEGPGVAPELRERVFENFFRIPGREPSDPRRVGVGLGLPIARRLVEAQGGRISIESPAGGHGTAVVLMLPMASVERESSPPPVAADSSTYMASGFARTLE
ncbi:MAG: ATP-binding protein [Acidobacteriota bacterium]